MKCFWKQEKQITICYNQCLNTQVLACGGDRLTEIGHWKIGKTLCDVMGFDFCGDIQMVGLEFGLNNNKASTKIPALYQQVSLEVIA